MAAGFGGSPWMTIFSLRTGFLAGALAGWAWGVKDAAMTPRPMLAVSTTAEPPATSLYSGRRAKALPEKYFMGFRLLNILSSLFPFIKFYYCLWS